MNDSNDRPKPLAGVDGEPVFTDPWQAQALALADTLVKNGMFSATEWSEALGQSLRDAQAEGGKTTSKLTTAASCGRSKC